MTHAFRLATFNLENLDDSGGYAETFEKRIQLLRPQLERLRADILCLQEVDAQKIAGQNYRHLRALDRLIEGTDYQTFNRATTYGSEPDSPRDVHNLVVLSRFPILKVEQFHNDLVPAYRIPTAEGIEIPDSQIAVAWDRPLLAVHIDLDQGRPLHVINCHFRASSGSFLPDLKSGPFSWKDVPGWAEAFYLSDLKRSGQALEARLLVDRWFNEDPKALIAVCGDLNAEPREVPLRLLQAGAEDTGNAGLAVRSLVSLSRHLPQDQRYSVLHHSRRQLLDHILVSHSLTATFRDLEIHNEALGDEVVAFKGKGQPLESFHAPLVATFG